VGADILDIDSMVDFGKAAQVFGGTKTAINGNVSPAEVMLMGSPETVAQKALECIEAGGDRCLIAAGCEVPLATPDENLFAFDRVLYRA
jgi:uroporphyrinogen decarboxylase